MNVGNHNGLYHQLGDIRLGTGWFFWVLNEAKQHDQEPEAKEKERLIINHDSKTLNNLGKRQGVSVLNVDVMKGLVKEKQELGFTNFKLEVMILHPCGYSQETVWDIVRDWRFIWGKRQVYLGVICIARVRKSMQFDDQSQWGCEYGKEQLPLAVMFGDPSGELVTSQKLTLLWHPEWRPCKV